MINFLSRSTVLTYLLAYTLFIPSEAKAQIFTPELTSEDRSDTRINGPLTLYGNLAAKTKVDVKLNGTAWGVSAPESKNHHLRLSSEDTGVGTDYIGLQFEMQGQYWHMMRVNFHGIHFTKGDRFSYSKIYASGFNQSSDVSLKTDVFTIADPLTLIDSLRGVRFNWIESGEPSIGFIAQEVKEVLPELVQGMEGSFSVEYANIVAVTVEAIKVLKAENRVLKSQNETLEARANALEARLGTVEAAIAELQGN